MKVDDFRQVRADLRRGAGGLPLAKSVWALRVVRWVAGLGDFELAAWSALLNHAVKARSASKPGVRWQDKADELIEAVGPAAFAARLGEWTEQLELDPKRPEPNIDLIKGLIWLAAGLDPAAVALPLGRFAEHCFDKVPDFGPRSAKLGNACLYALSEMADGGGAAQLARLKSKVRYARARRQIVKAFEVAAARAGRTVEELEEMAVPDFGLDRNGYSREPVGDFQAEIRITGAESVELAWLTPKGKLQQSVPAAVRRSHGETAAVLKQRVKEIKSDLSGQAARIERLYLSPRDWSFSDWRKLYLDHPLLSQITRRLIWRFRSDRVASSGIAQGDRIVDQSGEVIDWVKDGTRVALWHPIGTRPGEVLAWRDLLAAMEITQPFKQGHREICLRSVAEQRGSLYSNRFAGHVLRQQQFRALCQRRGWVQQAPEGGGPMGPAERRIEATNLVAEFGVEPAEQDATHGAAGLGYLVTGQLRFKVTGGGPVALADVPPMVFSEVMRDVDLFVSVTSIGNDPNWIGRGPEVPFRNYWHSYSFGTLSVSGSSRRHVLQDLLPFLKIADRCVLGDRFLTVRGRRRTYKIHLGSANILMAPNDQYLSVIRDAARLLAKYELHLPFEGDGTLARILGKAFLLAEDDKITDQKILSQIEMAAQPA